MKQRSTGISRNLHHRVRDGVPTGQHGKGSIALLFRGVYNGKEAVTKWQVVPSAGKGDVKDRD